MGKTSVIIFSLIIFLLIGLAYWITANDKWYSADFDCIGDVASEICEKEFDMDFQGVFLGIHKFRCDGRFESDLLKFKKGEIDHCLENGTKE